MFFVKHWTVRNNGFAIFKLSIKRTKSVALAKWLLTLTNSSMESHSSVLVLDASYASYGNSALLSTTAFFIGFVFGCGRPTQPVASLTTAVLRSSLMPPLLLIVLPSAGLIKPALMFLRPRCCIPCCFPLPPLRGRGENTAAAARFDHVHEYSLAVAQNSLLVITAFLFFFFFFPLPHSKVSRALLIIRQALAG